LSGVKSDTADRAPQNIGGKQGGNIGLIKRGVGGEKRGGQKREKKGGERGWRTKKNRASAKPRWADNRQAMKEHYKFSGGGAKQKKLFSCHD